MSLTTTDCAIPFIEGALVLWYVKGIPGYYYPTKTVAEMAARLVFPEESPDRRYGRIFYETFAPQD